MYVIVQVNDTLGRGHDIEVIGRGPEEDLLQDDAKAVYVSFLGSFTGDFLES